MRKIVSDHELDTVLFHQIIDKLARVFQVDTTKQKIDSFHIKSNMRRLANLRSLRSGQDKIFLLTFRIIMVYYQPNGWLIIILSAGTFGGVLLAEETEN